MQLSTDKMYELAVDGVKSGESKAMGKRAKLVFGIAPEDQDMVVNIRGPSALTTLTADKRISLRAKAKSCPKRKNKSDSRRRRKGKDEDEDQRRRRKREDEEGTEEGKKKSRRNQSKKKNGNSGDADDSNADGGQVENDQEKKARRKKNVEAGKRVKVRIKTFPSSSFPL